jgi:hypothetical protein
MRSDARRDPVGADHNSAMLSEALALTQAENDVSKPSGDVSGHDGR